MTQAMIILWSNPVILKFKLPHSDILVLFSFLLTNYLYFWQINMISIDVFGVRIGCFNNTRKKTPSIKSKNHISLSRKIMNFVAILLWLLLLPTLLFLLATKANVVIPSLSSWDMFRRMIINHNHLHMYWNKLMHRTD